MLRLASQPPRRPAPMASTMPFQRPEPVREQLRSRHHYRSECTALSMHLVSTDPSWFVANVQIRLLAGTWSALHLGRRSCVMPSETTLCSTEASDMLERPSHI